MKNTLYVYMQQIKGTLWNRIGNGKGQPFLLSQMTNRTKRWTINNMLEVQYIFQHIKFYIGMVTWTSMPKFMISLRNIITKNWGVSKCGKKIGWIQNIEIPIAPTYPNHLPLHTVLNETRFKLKFDKATMRLSESTNQNEVESKLWNIQDIFKSEMVK